MHDSHDSETDARPPSAVDRRAFLAAGVGAAGVAAISFYWHDDFGDPERRARIEPTPRGEPGRTFDALTMRTAAAACDRLLPSSPGAPGARDVNAARYLDALLATDEVGADKKAVLLDGLTRLNDRAKRAGLSEFSLGSPAQQDAMIRVFETFKVGATYPGHKWLQTMLRYILEAFLGDPVHGGNPGEIGWKWIGHTPGSPRPTTPGWKPKPRDA